MLHEIVCSPTSIIAAETAIKDKIPHTTVTGTERKMYDFTNKVTLLHITALIKFNVL